MTHSSGYRSGMIAILVAGLLSACSGTPPDVTPDLLGYDRAGLAHQNRAVELENRVAELANALNAQRQLIATQDQRISELDTAAVLRGRSLAALKKDQLAADARLEAEKTALKAEIDVLRRRVADLEAALERTSMAVARMAGEAAAAQTMSNRQAAEAMAAAGDPMVGSVEAGQSYAVHLASYRDADKAREGWQALQVKYSAVLGQLDYKLAALNLDSLGGRYLRLLAGPLDSVASARGVCERLRQNDQFCQVAVYDSDLSASSDN